MKTANKLKIINFVKKVIGYSEPDYIKFKTYERKVIDLKISLVLKKHEFEIPEIMDSIILKEFSKDLIKIGAIQVREVEMFDKGHSLVELRKYEAFMSVVK